ncbi:MAG: TolC family protein [Bacteroidota bacterium]
MRGTLITLLVVVACFPVHAQLSFSSFQEVLQYADAHALVVQQALMNEQIADAEFRAAKLDRLPSVNASLGYNDNITLQPALVPEQLFNPNAESGSLQELTFGTKFQYTRSMQVSWDVLNFQQKFAIQTAKIAAEESRLNTDLARFNTYNALAATYYSLLLNQEAVNIYAENLEVAEQVFVQAQDKFQRGVISEPELNRAEINQHQNRSRLQQTLSQVEQLRLQLQDQLNTEEAVVIQDSISGFLLSSYAITSKHPQIAFEAVQMERSESILRQTKARRAPTVSLVYQNNQTWATDKFMNFSEGNNLPQQLFGVQINMPGLFDFGTKQRIKQAKKQVELQRLTYEGTLRSTQREDDLLVLQLQEANGQLEINEHVLSLQEGNDAHANNQYEAGLLSLDQRLDKYGELLNAQDNYLQSLASQTLAKYKIFIRQINF